VRDANGQQLTYVYFEDGPGRRSVATLLERDEARQIAFNITKLPMLLGRHQTWKCDEGIGGTHTQQSRRPFGNRRLCLFPRQCQDDPGALASSGVSRVKTVKSLSVRPRKYTPRTCVFSTFYSHASNANSGDARGNKAPEALSDYGPFNINAQDRRGRYLFLSKTQP